MADPREFDPATVIVRAAAAKREAQRQAEARQAAADCGTAESGRISGQKYSGTGSSIAGAVEQGRRERCLALAVQLVAARVQTGTQFSGREYLIDECICLADAFYDHIRGPAVPAEPKSED